MKLRHCRASGLFRKTDSIVQLTLLPDANIYASEYSLYLPDKELLQEMLDEWTQEYEYGQNKL